MLLPEYLRNFYPKNGSPLRIGTGSLGGKAAGLVNIFKAIYENNQNLDLEILPIRIPQMVVIATDLFDSFMEQNQLHKLSFNSLSDDRIAEEFQNAHLPATLTGDLRSIAQQVHTPLAIRSSSKLEDALKHPFAGVYATKMIPNNQPEGDRRFRKLTEAIKLVYASTFFAAARRYAEAIGEDSTNEKMAVIIQEVAGLNHNNRFYPDISGVARSCNYYPFGHATRKDGVTNLALGLGKTIVEGSTTWSYCQAYPASPAPFKDTKDLLNNTQRDFWSINMNPITDYNPIRENEYLQKGCIEDAHYDNTLHRLASTYNAASDRMELGTGKDGPRVIDFSPVLKLKESFINETIKRAVAIGEDSLGGDMEMEFAITFDTGPGFQGRFDLLQVRGAFDKNAKVEILADEIAADNCIAFSSRVMGCGEHKVIRDIVYVRSDTFDPAKTISISREINLLNAALQKEGRPYLLIGFGRWGTTDPWRGIPVTWDQISGAKTIIEAERDELGAMFSQGSHFFHNMTAFSVSYFDLPLQGDFKLNMKWIESQELVTEQMFTRHVRIAHPLTVKIDGDLGRGVILHD